MPEFTLTGRVALITGAARGIGLSIAKTFVAAGASVVIQDIDEALAQQEAAALGSRAIGIGGDAKDVANADLWIAKTIEQFGGLHILVNNASIQHHLDFFEQTEAIFHDEFNANVLLIMRLCQLALPHMTANGWGRILNIGSIQGRGGNHWMVPYAMTKAAIENMTKSLARRFGRDGVTVNNLAPGWINTWRNRFDLEGADLKEKGKFIPLRRLGEADDCAGPALMLCSDAGRYMTGQTIYVDGGMSI